MKTETMLLIGGAALLGYEFIIKPQTAVPVSVPASQLPGGSTAPVNSAAPPSTTNVYGVNQGQRGGNGSFDLAANYSSLVSYDPNLRNSNYQMTPAQIATYLNNYQDLRTGLPGWLNRKDPSGKMLVTLNDAAQSHWMQFGSKEGRIYYPLIPVSGEAYIPAPAAPKSSGGGGFLSAALGIVTKVAPIVAMFAGTEDLPELNQADKNLLFTGAAVLAEILPMYEKANPMLVQAINKKLNLVLQNYS